MLLTEVEHDGPCAASLLACMDRQWLATDTTVPTKLTGTVLTSLPHCLIAMCMVHQSWHAAIGVDLEEPLHTHQMMHSYKGALGSSWM